jgi:hypothetical protein
MVCFRLPPWDFALATPSPILYLAEFHADLHFIWRFCIFPFLTELYVPNYTLFALLVQNERLVWFRTLRRGASLSVNFL